MTSLVWKGQRVPRGDGQYKVSGVAVPRGLQMRNRFLTSPMAVAPPVFLLVVAVSLRLATTTSPPANASFPLPKCHPSPKNATTTIFLSSGRFVFGCFPSTIASSFLPSVTFSNLGVAPPLIWSPNASLPVPANSSQLLLDNQGDVLLELDGSVAWRAHTKNVAHISLLNTGNLVFLNSSNSIVWASFDHPLDLILPSQTLRQGMQLVSGSSSSTTLPASVSFSAVMEPGGLALFVNSTEDHFPALPYYVSGFGNDSGSNHLDQVLDTPCNNTDLWLSSNGSQLIMQQQIASSRTCNVTVAKQLGANISVDYLRLELDGNLQGYKFTNKVWTEVYDLFSSKSLGVCHLPSICGPYGICSSDNGSFKCSCPGNSSSNDVFLPMNNSDLTQGCKLLLPLNCSIGQYFIELQGADYFANDAISHNTSLRSKEDCLQACASNCSCAAAFYRSDMQACYHYEQVLSIIQSANLSYVAFLKVQNISAAPISAATGTNRPILTKTSFIVGIVLGSFAALVCVILCGLLYRRRKKRLGTMALEDDFSEGTLPGQPIRFSFTELQEATQKFNCKLGVGGFGSVYKGTLSDGSPIAVKQLECARQGYKEFRTEVIDLGRNANHQNLVRLVGFCAEGSHRLLVYEYMPNGSLDAWIFHRPNEATTRFLNWNTRFQIALDVARGLVFLHEDSREKIIHLDVKPQNILLGDKLVAKLSDFGQCKLMEQDESRVLTHMRGTPGYMAPEWLLHTSATEKSDVYSFGMVLLELLGGRKNVDLSKPRESWYFPALAARMYEEGREREIMDERLQGIFMEDEKQFKEARRVMQTAFWCIQEEPKLRPTMGRALLMLEGDNEMVEPPLHFQFATGSDQRSPQITSTKNSLGCLNILGSGEPLTNIQNEWSGGLYLDDCSLLLSARD